MHFFLQIATNNGGNTIYVELYLHSAGLSCVFITPPQNPTFSSGGLCGVYDPVLGGQPPVIWEKLKKRDANEGYYSKSIDVRDPAQIDLLAEFWRYVSKM